MEDLLEEIVGEIRDEFDEEPQKVVKVPGSEDTWEVDGRAAMDELRTLGVQVAEAELGETVGALVVELLGRLPARGRQGRLRSRRHRGGDRREPATRDARADHRQEARSGGAGSLTTRGVGRCAIVLLGAAAPRRDHGRVRVAHRVSRFTFRATSRRSSRESGDAGGARAVERARSAGAIPALDPRARRRPRRRRQRGRRHRRVAAPRPVGRARHRRAPGPDCPRRSDSGVGLRRAGGSRAARRARDARGHARSGSRRRASSSSPQPGTTARRSGSRAIRCASRRCRGSRGPSSRRARRPTGGQRLRRRRRVARASSSRSRAAARSSRPTRTPSSKTSSARRLPRRARASRPSSRAGTRSRWRPRR